jgi:hypothetical protein
MAQRTIYVDVDDNQIITSPIDATPAPFPALILGDSPLFKIVPLQRNNDGPGAGAFGGTPYLFLNNASLSLKAGIGPKDGLANHILYASQFTWDKDLLNQAFTAEFALTQVALAALIGQNESAETWFELALINENGKPWRILQKRVSVQGQVITQDTLTGPPDGESALSLSEANGRFITRKIVGSLYFQDIDDPTKWIAVYNKGGSLQEDPVIGDLP